MNFIKQRFVTTAAAAPTELFRHHSLLERRVWPKGWFIVVLGAILTTGASANLIADASFEDPNFSGFWQFVNGGGNNTSVWNDNNDGLGFFNVAFGDFTGVNAEDGHHWIAAYSGDSGAWGQHLAAPLVAGETYSLDGWAHRSVRPDLDSAGGW